MGPQCELLETVLTCKGNYYAPDFTYKFKELKCRLQQLIVPDSEKSLFVEKVEPWNSVRVTLKLPVEATNRLRELAEQQNAVLREMGVLAVQVEGGRSISLSLDSTPTRSEANTQCPLQSVPSNDSLPHVALRPSSSSPFFSSTSSINYSNSNFVNATPSFSASTSTHTQPYLQSLTLSHFIRDTPPSSSVFSFTSNMPQSPIPLKTSLHHPSSLSNHLPLDESHQNFASSSPLLVNLLKSPGNRGQLNSPFLIAAMATQENIMDSTMMQHGFKRKKNQHKRAKRLKEGLEGSSSFNDSQELQTSSQDAISLKASEITEFKNQPSSFASSCSSISSSFQITSHLASPMTITSSNNKSFSISSSYLSSPSLFPTTSSLIASNSNSNNLNDFKKLKNQNQYSNLFSLSSSLSSNTFPSSSLQSSSFSSSTFDCQIPNNRQQIQASFVSMATSNNLITLSQNIINNATLSNNNNSSSNNFSNNLQVHNKQPNLLNIKNAPSLILNSNRPLSLPLLSSDLLKHADLSLLKSFLISNLDQQNLNLPPNEALRTLTVSNNQSENDNKLLTTSNSSYNFQPIKNNFPQQIIPFLNKQNLNQLTNGHFNSLLNANININNNNNNSNNKNINLSMNSSLSTITVNNNTTNNMNDINNNANNATSNHNSFNINNSNFNNNTLINNSLVNNSNINTTVNNNTTVIVNSSQTNFKQNDLNSNPKIEEIKQSFSSSSFSSSSSTSSFQSSSISSSSFSSQINSMGLSVETEGQNSNFNQNKNTKKSGKLAEDFPAFKSKTSLTVAQLLEQVEIAKHNIAPNNFTGQSQPPSLSQPQQQYKLSDNIPATSVSTPPITTELNNKQIQSKITNSQSLTNLSLLQNQSAFNVKLDSSHLPITSPGYPHNLTESVKEVMKNIKIQQSPPSSPQVFRNTPINKNLNNNTNNNYPINSNKDFKISNTNINSNNNWFTNDKKIKDFHYTLPMQVSSPNSTSSSQLNPPNSSIGGTNQHQSPNLLGTEGELSFCFNAEDESHLDSIIALKDYDDIERLAEALASNIDDGNIEEEMLMGETFFNEDLFTNNNKNSQVEQQSQNQQDQFKHLQHQHTVDTTKPKYSNHQQPSVQNTYQQTTQRSQQQYQSINQLKQTNNFQQQQQKSQFQQMQTQLQQQNHQMNKLQNHFNPPHQKFHPNQSPPQAKLLKPHQPEQPTNQLQHQSIQSQFQQLQNQKHLEQKSQIDQIQNCASSSLSSFATSTSSFFFSSSSSASLVSPLTCHMKSFPSNQQTEVFNKTPIILDNQKHKQLLREDGKVKNETSSDSKETKFSSSSLPSSPLYPLPPPPPPSPSRELKIEHHSLNLSLEKKPNKCESLDKSESIDKEDEETCKLEEENHLGSKKIRKRGGKKEPPSFSPLPEKYNQEAQSCLGLTRMSTRSSNKNKNSASASSSSDPGAVHELRDSQEGVATPRRSTRTIKKTEVAFEMSKNIDKQKKVSKEATRDESKHKHGISLKLETKSPRGPKPNKKYQTRLISQNYGTSPEEALGELRGENPSSDVARKVNSEQEDEPHTSPDSTPTKKQKVP